eukprot:4896895-Amphidinium_carterae.1
MKPNELQCKGCLRSIKKEDLYPSTNFCRPCKKSCDGLSKSKSKKSGGVWRSEEKQLADAVPSAYVKTRFFCVCSGWLGPHGRGCSNTLERQHGERKGANKGPGRSSSCVKSRLAALSCWCAWSLALARPSTKALIVLLSQRQRTKPESTKTEASIGRHPIPTLCPKCGSSVKPRWQTPYHSTSNL